MKSKLFPWKHATLIAAIPALIQLLVAAWVPFYGSSEAREAQVMDTIVRTGEWILPLRNGIVPSKPPLEHWFGAAFGHALGGVTEFVSRLPSILFAAITALLTMLLTFRCARLVPLLASRAASSAILSGYVITTTYGFYRMSVDARVDMTLTVFITAALVAIIPALAAAGRSVDEPLSVPTWRWFYLWCGLGVLAKGPLGVVLPLVIGGAYSAVVGSARNALRWWLRPRDAWIFFALIAMPWYLAAILQSGDTFLDRQIVYENLQRLIGGESVAGKSWWFYLPAILTFLAPWSFVLFILAWSLRRDLKKMPRSLHAGVLWLLSGVTFFSLAAGKREAYLLPLIPGLAVSTALYAQWWWIHATDRARAALGPALSLMMIAPALLGLIVLAGVDLAPYRWWLADPGVSRIAEMLGGKRSIVVSLALISLLASIWGGLRKVSLSGRGFVVWLVMMVVSNIALGIGHYVKAELKDFRGVAAAVEQIAAGRQITVIKDRFDELFDPVFFYLHRGVRIAIPGEVVDCDGVFLATPDVFNAARTSQNGAAQELASFTQFADRVSKRDDRTMVLFDCMVGLGLP